MPYSDEAYFLTRIKQEELDNLLNDENGDEIEGRLAGVIATADDMINGYLKAGGVTLPLATVPESIKQCSYAIATYYLHDFIQYSDIPERVSENYDKAVKFLEGVSSGKIDLNNTAQSESEETGIWFLGDGLRFSQNTF